MESPQSYARHLATYIASPLKIEKLVALEFDEVPPLHQIAEFRYRVEQQSKRFKRLSEVGLAEVAEPEVRTYPKGGTVYTPVSVEIADEVPPPPVRSHREVVAAVAKAFDLTYKDVIGPDRHAKFVCARTVAARILRDRGNSYKRIGHFLGNRDHSTADNLVKGYERRLARHPQIGVVYEQLTTGAEEVEA